MKKQAIIRRRFSKMNSTVLLKKVFNGDIKKSEAGIVASIVEKRFPTPKG